MISKILKIPRPSALNLKSYARSLEHFFLTVGNNNFGNKIPFLRNVIYTMHFFSIVFVLNLHWAWLVKNTTRYNSFCKSPIWFQLQIIWFFFARIEYQVVGYLLAKKRKTMTRSLECTCTTYQASAIIRQSATFTELIMSSEFFIFSMNFSWNFLWTK